MSEKKTKEAEKRKLLKSVDTNKKSKDKLAEVRKDSVGGKKEGSDSSKLKTYSKNDKLTSPPHNKTSSSSSKLAASPKLPTLPPKEGQKADRAKVRTAKTAPTKFRTTGNK